MKTNLLKLLCVSIAMTMCMSVSAQATNGSCGTNATWEYDSGTLTISGSGTITTYSTEMPTAYPWYAYANSIQSVIIGEGITNIPDWAFAMYDNLRSISLPSTLTSIGNSSLEETNLWNVSLPEGLQTIGHYAFLMCPFTAVSLPSTVTSIGQSAFAYCMDMTSVGCYAATPPALYDNTVFDQCDQLATIYVPSAKVADYKAASNWSTYSALIQSPAGYCGPDGNDDDSDNDVTKATWSFEMATRTLTIQGTKMGQYNRPWESAGMGGSGGGFNPDNEVGYPMGIQHVIIGEGITAIPASSFYMEIGIHTVTLPSTLTKIGMDAFGECFNIETITCNATTPPALASAGVEDHVFYGEVNWNTYTPLPISTLTAIYVPAASAAAYKAAPGWSVYQAIIQAAGSSTSVVTPNVNTKAIKHIVNGQLLIEKNGKFYNALGAEVK